MLIRKMGEADIAAAAAIEKKSITPPWSEQSFYDALQEDTLMLVAEGERGEILGYINMYISFEEGEITNVAVDPAHRGQGIADEMMDYFFLRAEEKGIERIVLEVRASNAPAIGLYRKKGFTLLGKRKNFYEQPREDALIMELKLC